MNYRKQVITLIIVSSLVRMIVAAATELSNDEVYYWTYAQYLQWNYFDHPPMIGLLIRLFTGNLLFEQEFFIRLGSIACAAINTWQMYRLVRQLKDAYTGWIAACLFTASVYAGILAGVMILPDAPQMVFWLWSLILLVQIFKSTGSERNRNRRLLLLGAAAGLCIMSKVHGVFIWGGAMLYILLFARTLLRNPFLYLALLITGIMIAPIIWWNLNNEFITLNYHGDRVGFFGKIQWDTFFRQIIGEILYNNPVNMVFIVAGLIAIRSTKLLNEYGWQRILLMVSLPLMVVVWLMSLFKDTLPHWTGPAYTTLIPLAAAYITRRLPAGSTAGYIPRAIKAALALPALLLVLLIAGIHWLPVSMGSKDDQHLGAGDLLLDMSGWKQFGQDFNRLYQQDIAAGTMKRDAFMMADYWFPAAHLDYYVARPAGINFIAAGSFSSIHHYAWLNIYRPAPEPGQDAYYVAVSNYFDPLPSSIIASFRQAEGPVVINQRRQGKVVRHFFIYRLKHYQGGIPRNGVLE
ncbi:glycosyltransferase family 39 protein [Pseudoflavitalea sp. X16]|uniref:ArnT family glycosyltransferase n=1 Tax=Paraflavitalea devenefica TaxID=2716334 RepID=UPI001420632E|nr:glycosyltransferase family 39 protein [Paraflavitalea devenefica]NII23893.1 glycosyltransferase family 39 protein [Paraflavitalea devenefica]